MIFFLCGHNSYTADVLRDYSEVFFAFPNRLFPAVSSVDLGLSHSQGYVGVGSLLFMFEEREMWILRGSGLFLQGRQSSSPGLCLNWEVYRQLCVHDFGVHTDLFGMRGLWRPHNCQDVEAYFGVSISTIVTLALPGMLFIFFIEEPSDVLVWV